LSSTPATRRRRMTAEARREVIERAATEVFAERGYRSASMDEIATRSGISVPILYDHFRSKRDLHRRLLERHFADLRVVWGESLSGDDSPDLRMHHALDSWFAYVQEHPYAWRMLFADTSGDPGVAAIHREVAAESRALLLPLLARDAATEVFAGSDGQEALEMLWEILRGVLQGLALWWYDHQHVPRKQVVATAMNALWLGFDRVRLGESFKGRA